MSAVLRQTAAELRKVLSTRVWWLLAIVLVAYTGFMAPFMAFFLSDLGEALGAGSSLPDLQVAQLVYATTTSIGYVFPVMLGALSVTAEHRHGSLTPTLLAQPRRGVVVAGKAAALLLFGAAYGLAGCLGSVGAGAAVIAATGGDPLLGDPEILAMLGRIVLAMALWALIGVALGGLITNQVAVIVIVLAFTQFVEPLLRTFGGFWEWSANVVRYLPGAATDALAGAGLFSSLGALDPSAGMQGSLLDWWQGGLVLAGIAVVAFAVSLATTWRRDVG